MAEKMTRRTFMKGAAAAAIAVSLSGVLAGCGGGGGLAQDEVRVGAFVVKVFNATGNVGGTSFGSGSNGYINATVKLTYSSTGSGTVEYPYNGMFAAKIDETDLKVVKPTSGTLKASNQPILGSFMKENQTELSLDFPTSESSGAFKDGKPVELTIKIDNAVGVLYLTGVNGKIVVTNTKPAV